MNVSMSKWWHVTNARANTTTCFGARPLVTVADRIAAAAASGQVTTRSFIQLIDDVRHLDGSGLRRHTPDSEGFVFWGGGTSSSWYCDSRDDISLKFYPGLTYDPTLTF